MCIFGFPGSDPIQIEILSFSTVPQLWFLISLCYRKHVLKCSSYQIPENKIQANEYRPEGTSSDFKRAHYIREVFQKQNGSQKWNFPTTKPQPPSLHQTFVNTFSISTSTSATMVTSASIELVSSLARVTSIKFTKQELGSQSVRESLTSIANDRTRVR